MEQLLSYIDNTGKSGWISQAAGRQSYGQTSQKRATGDLLVNAVMQDQQCPRNCGRNSMQDNEHTSNGFRNTDLVK